MMGIDRHQQTSPKNVNTMLDAVPSSISPGPHCLVYRYLGNHSPLVRKRDSAVQPILAAQHAVAMQNLNDEPGPSVRIK